MNEVMRKMYKPLTTDQARMIGNGEERIFALTAIAKGLEVRKQIGIKGGSVIDFHVSNPRSKRSGRYVEVTRTRPERLFKRNEYGKLDPRLTIDGSQKDRQLENINGYPDGGVVLSGDIIDRLATLMILANYRSCR